MAEAASSGSPVEADNRDNITGTRAAPLSKDLIYDHFSPDHCLNVNYLQGFSTLRIGENIEDFVSAPANVDVNEWIAYHLHHLIDRVCVLFDLMKFFCNDGVFRIDFNQPMAYALPVRASDISEVDRGIINTAKPKCSNVVMIAEHKYLKTSDLSLAPAAGTGDWAPAELLNEPTHSLNPQQGAASYINDALRALKSLRSEAAIFPRDRNSNFPANFTKYAKFIAYHLITILSHYLTCHFEDINRLNIRMHIITLSYNIFCLAEKFDLLPQSNKYSPDFLLINRVARHFECQNYQLQGAEAAVGQ